MTKIVMEMSDDDIRHADELTEQWNMRSKADTVRTALTLTHEIAKAAGKSGEVTVTNKEGKVSKLRLEAVFG